MQDDTNVVTLCGRLSGEVELRDVPSGDSVAVWRLVVGRPSPTPGRVSVDTIDCESFGKGVQRKAERWTDGNVIAVEGSLRRRFWQTPAGARSRYVVDVRSARKMADRRET